MFKLFRRKDNVDEVPDELLEEPQPIAVYENISHTPINSPIATVQYVGATAVATITATDLIGNDSARGIAELFAQLHQGGIQQIVLDAQGLQQVDQTVFSALVDACNRVVQNGGKIALAGAAATLQQAIRTTGLDRVFPLCGDVMAAMNAVERRASGAPVLGW